MVQERSLVFSLGLVTFGGYTLALGWRRSDGQAPGKGQGVQVRTFAGTDADMVAVFAMNYTDEGSTDPVRGYHRQALARGGMTC